MANNRLAAQIVGNVCKDNSSPWVTREQLENYTKKNGGNIIDIMSAAKEKLIVSANGLYTTKELHVMENSICEELLRIHYEYPLQQVEEKAILKLISDYEKENAPIKFDFIQKQAVVTAVNNRVSVLTGGPGTGKTTVISCISYCLRRIHKTIGIVYSAPTSMAASRLAEATGEDAVTVHKYFGITPNGLVKNTFCQDVLIIDEMSFLDMITLSQVLSNIESKTRLILCGDPHQLPSVGIGRCFKDIVDSNVLPITKLIKTFRQEEGSLLLKNIKLVKRGEIELEKGTDFHPVQISRDMETREIEKRILKIYLGAVKAKGIENVKLIVPTNNTPIGTKNLNKHIQHLLNPDGVPFKCKLYGEEVMYKVGDPVVQKKNQEYANNGEIGYVTAVSSTSLTVKYKNGENIYTKETIEELELGYAITVHKSQGSEAEVVISVCLKEHTRLFNRNFLFTAISRSKKQHVIIYHEAALKECLSKDAYNNRYSRLGHKLYVLNSRYKLAIAS
ncbi:MAG: hypothetical protein E7272_07745 [Pseudobutyrivibrio ruminis]|uniref:AAA+ ATPase domain-containing protein n=1 Tax=Pseudobutyrivibrio ruminis TaxID=46206 RepID=A0A927YLK1_9FIRM|nr:hypothetical protein [Pseudobutyrivibrio ruminis]